MDLSAALIARLNAVEAVSDIFEDRIYWVERDQGGGLPALVLTSAGGPPEETDLDGECDSVESVIQGSSFAATHREARLGAKAFADALRGNFDAGNVKFWDGDPARPIDSGDSDTGGFVHQTIQDVTVRHSPAA